MFKAYRLFVSVVLLVALGAGYSGYSVPNDRSPAPLAFSGAVSEGTSTAAAPRNYTELQQKLMGLYRQGLLPRYVITAKANGFDAETALGLPKEPVKLSDLEAIRTFLKLSREAEMKTYAYYPKQNSVSGMLYRLAGLLASVENPGTFVVAGN